MFLPTTRKELESLGWDKCDVILVSGDTYIDSPYIGTAVIGKILFNAGYKVGIIAQPDLNDPADIRRLGEPILFWGVTSGSVDSMVSNYTATGKPRRNDDYTPGGKNNRRPDRAVIRYSNLIRQYFRNTSAIVLGGIEASLRRVAHYDYWQDKIRRSILLDAKADFLIYGMGETSILELAASLKKNQPPTRVRGLSYLSNEKVEQYLELPSYEEVINDSSAFIDMYHQFYKNNDPKTASGLVQKHGDRYVIQNPPAEIPSQQKMDDCYAIEFERDVHPYYKSGGEVRALNTIRFAVKSHHGCYGECNFCAIAVHEGRTVYWRSEENILKEIRQLTLLPGFKGYIADLGGPTANMYGFECVKKLNQGVCEDKRCLFPEVCRTMKTNHKPAAQLLKKARQIPGIKKVFVASGIRYDMILDDKKSGFGYLEEVVEHHVSGQMKIAPEHTEDEVLRMMGKPGKGCLNEFRNMYESLNKKHGKKQFLTYYLIAAHPGCTEKHMQALKQYTAKELKIHPEQVQIFTPTPGTYSSVMYHTGINPFNGKPLFVEKNFRGKTWQKTMVTGRQKRPQKTGPSFSD